MGVERQNGTNALAQNLRHSLTHFTPFRKPSYILTNFLWICPPSCNPLYSPLKLRGLPQERGG